MIMGMVPLARHMAVITPIIKKITAVFSGISMLLNSIRRMSLRLAPVRQAKKHNSSKPPVRGKRILIPK